MYHENLEGEDKKVYFSLLKYARITFEISGQIYEDVCSEIYTSLLELAEKAPGYKYNAIRRRINNLMATVIIATPSLEEISDDYSSAHENPEYSLEKIHENPEYSLEKIEVFLLGVLHTKQPNSRHARYVENLAKVLLLSAIHGKSWEKIAVEVGVTPRNVKRMLAILRKIELPTGGKNGE